MPGPTQVPQALPSTAPPSAPNFMPPPPTPLNGQTAYGYNQWALQQAASYPGYYPAYNTGYYPVVPASYAPGYAPAYGSGYNTPSYWYGQ